MEASPAFTLPPRVRFPGLASAAFEHPADRAALETLRRTPGLDRLIKWMYELGVERLMRIFYVADSIRVSPRQYSRLYNDLREACAILDVTEPELYVVQLPIPNAVTFGMERHTIVMTTALLDLLNDSERLWAIGHELGHIKAEHLLYRTMALWLASVLKRGMDIFAMPGKILSITLAYALFEWFRKAELTADRAGLLTIQDPQVCITGLLKLVGGSQRLMDDLNPEEFTKQADQYEDMDDSLLNMYFKYLIVLKFMEDWEVHPFPVMRAREIKEWAQSQQYRRLLRGDYPRTDTEAGKRTCAACGTVVTNVAYRFCPECGQELGPVPAS
ncbi:MAG TPA: M48 family metalloprotease [Chthonomonadaceae bacterium]|nr:M48 family metalloprotease [Chthonomonadaceae bacterium]